MLCPYATAKDCRCPLLGVWHHEGSVTVYPCSKLIACQGLLVRYSASSTSMLCVHKLGAASNMRLWALQWPFEQQKDLMFSMTSKESIRPSWNESCPVFWCGMQKIRSIQRWFRRHLLLKQNSHLAVMMSTQKRLGDNSPLMLLDENILRLVVLQKKN